MARISSKIVLMILQDQAEGLMFYRITQDKTILGSVVISDLAKILIVQAHATRLPNFHCLQVADEAVAIFLEYHRIEIGL